MKKSGLPIIFDAFMLIFAVAQTVESSGFLAIYMVGFILGSRRHRATQLIMRFSDGFSWLAQILMFLIRLRYSRAGRCGRFRLKVGRLAGLSQ